MDTMVESSQSDQRRLPACERCRIRKTKCDSRIPSCLNCEKAGVDCMNNDKVLGRAVTRNYVWSLEEKIRGFEETQDLTGLQSAPLQYINKRRKLSNNQDQGSPKGQSTLPDSCTSRSPSDPSQNQQQSKMSRSYSVLSSNTLNDDENEDCIRDKMDTLISSTFSIGSASHVSDDLDYQIKQYLSPPSILNSAEIFKDKEQASIRRLIRDFLKQARRNNTKNRLTDITAYDYALLTRLAKRYFAWMSSALPVLHECMFHLQLDSFWKRPNEASQINKFQ